MTKSSQERAAVRFKLTFLDVGTGECYAEATLDNGQVWFLHTNLNDDFELQAEVRAPAKYIDQLADEELGKIVRALSRPTTRLMGALARASEIDTQRKQRKQRNEELDRETFAYYLSKRDQLAPYKGQHPLIDKVLAFLDRGYQQSSSKSS